MKSFASGHQPWEQEVVECVRASLPRPPLTVHGHCYPCRLNSHRTPCRVPRRAKECTRTAALCEMRPSPQHLCNFSERSRPRRKINSPLCTMLHLSFPYWQIYTCGIIRHRALQCVLCARLCVSLSLLSELVQMRALCYQQQFHSAALLVFRGKISSNPLCPATKRAPSLYVHENEAHVRESESTKLLLSALSAPFLLLFTFANSLCVCVLLRWTHSRSPAPGFNFLENSFCVSHLCI